MLPDYGRYYGSALTHVIDHSSRPISIERLELGVQGYYLINGKIPLYIKFSRNRKGPWPFTFQRDHQVQYQKIADQYGDCILALVCGKDGIVALNYAQVREVLDGDFDDQEGITVRRKFNRMYSVGGSSGELSRKIRRDSLVQQILKLSEGDGALYEAASTVVGAPFVDVEDAVS